MRPPHTASPLSSNAFRTLGLDATATLEEVRRRGDERLLQLELRGGGAADMDGVRRALVSLDDPARRLDEELYWFHESDDAARRALEIDSQADVDAACEALRPLVEAGSDSALHDLALVELEIASRSGNEAVQVWKSALEHWAATWSNEQFWERMRQRSAVLGDGLVTETIERLRAGLPKRVLEPHIVLVDRLLGENQDTLAAEHLAMLLEVGLPLASVWEARAAATAGVRVVLRAALDQASASLSTAVATPPANRSAAVSNAWRGFEADVLPVVERLKRMDARGPEVQILIDEAAECAITLGVVLHEDQLMRREAFRFVGTLSSSRRGEPGLDPAIDALELASQIAASESVQARAADNLHVVRQRQAVQDAISRGQALDWAAALEHALEAQRLAVTETEQLVAKTLVHTSERAALIARRRWTLYDERLWVAAVVVIILIGFILLLRAG